MEKEFPSVHWIDFQSGLIIFDYRMIERGEYIYSSVGNSSETDESRVYTTWREEGAVTAPVSESWIVETNGVRSSERTRIDNRGINFTGSPWPRSRGFNCTDFTDISLKKARSLIRSYAAAAPPAYFDYLPAIPSVRASKDTSRAVRWNLLLREWYIRNGLLKKLVRA